MRYILAAILLILPALSFADTHYVRKTGSGSACTQGAPCLTIAAGIASMVGGDTLVIGDGTYVGDPVSNVPSGSSGAWTAVRSENVGGVTIDMSGASDWGATAINVGSSDHHIQIEGFKAKASLTAWSNGAVHSSGSYIKLFRIASYNARQNGNTASFVIGTGSDHVLVEDCWSWGTGRYKFIAYMSTNVIFRRCVARHDYNTDVPGGEGLTQQATFVNYDSTNTLFQNCIAIDSGVHGSGQEIYGGFWDENNGDIDKSGKITGSIVLNFRTNQAGMADKVSGTRSITDSIIWDSGGGWGAIMRGATSFDPTVTLNQNTFGNLVYNFPGTYGMYGVGSGSAGNWNISTTNSIIYGANSYGISDYMYSDWNVLYGNGANYGGWQTPTAGTHDITNHNPLTNGLRYLPRIESGTYLASAGYGGSRIGAEILYRHGTSGTLYGDTGYDTLTAEPLWPFPNESLIKTDFASYADTGPTGARGFATGTSLDGSAQTLTKYIWEYLGNQIPANIYTKTYYVRPDGNDSNTGSANTAGSAFLTIQKAVNLTNAGDTVMVADGDYTGFYVDRTGTAAAPITIKAIGTGANIIHPLWRGYLTNPPTERTDGINIEAYSPDYASYITVDGFKVYGMPRIGIRAVGGTGVIIKNCTSHNNVMGILTGNTPNIQILSNITYSNGNTTNDHNIYVSNAESDGAIIRGNLIYNSTSGNGLQLNGDPPSGGDGFIDNALIENNIIYGNTQKGMSLICVRSCRIQNNIIYNNGMSAGGIHIVDQLDTHYSTGNIVVNNTIDETNYIAAVRINSGSTNNYVFNNVALGASGGIVFEGTGNFQNNNLTTTPTFVNRAGRDYRLVSGSAAINAGVASYMTYSAPALDFLGASRPANSLFDIGAYEFGATIPFFAKYRASGRYSLR
jgi:parallel beta-helix repeat protein